MPLNVKGEGLGARVTGIDPGRLADLDGDELRELIYRNKLIVLKDVHPSPAQFLQLGRIVGEVVTYYEPIYHHRDFPEIFVSSTEQGQGVPKTGAFWHIDYMFMPQPFAFSMVVPLTVPGSDRGTYFIDLNRVWESLPVPVVPVPRLLRQRPQLPPRRPLKPRRQRRPLKPRLQSLPRKPRPKRPPLPRQRQSQPQRSQRPKKPTRPNKEF